MRRRLTSPLLIAVFAIALAGCTRPAGPVRDSRETLGTVVSVTTYVIGDGDEATARTAIDAAYDEMGGVEAALDAHDPDSAVAKINADGRGTLPPEALEVLAAIDRLGVADEFSPYLLEVIALYDFEGGGSVPETATLESHLAMSRDWGVKGTQAYRASAGWLGQFNLAPTGLDFGGAAKGLALDRAVGVLAGSSAIEGALVTAGSTTVTHGSKPDGEPWRIAVEDPRDTDATIATVEANGTVTVSTSGDYQRYFERDGIRYHHILDPATGSPARGLRSLTVAGVESGLDSDILSTALFVMGPERAVSYAQEHDLGLVLVDDEGRVRVVPGPEDASWSIVEGAR